MRIIFKIMVKLPCSLQIGMKFDDIKGIYVSVVSKIWYFPDFKLFLKDSKTLAAKGKGLKK